MKKVLLCLLFLLIVFPRQSSTAEEITKKVVAILPFDAIDIPVSDAENLTRDITSGFSNVQEASTISYDDVLEAFRDASIIKDSTCKNRVCLLAVGKSLQSEIVFTGSLYKVDNRVSFSFVAIDCRDNTTLWSKDYSCDCELKDFLKKTAYAAVIDARYAILLAEKSAKKGDASSESSDSSGSGISEATTDNKIDSVSIEETADQGTVNGVTIGFNGRYVLGSTASEESEWSAETMVLFPTSDHSHLRTRISLPSSTSKDMYNKSNISEDNDLLFSIDHEWGFKRFGITFGAAYMYMDGFKKEIDGHNYTFNDVNLFSWVLGIRAGLPNRGFRGRVCYPMPFAITYGKSEQNTFVEYSAFGMFGNEKVKGGVGIQGTYKRRFSKEVVWSSYNWDDSKESVKEYYLMAPSGKISFLAGTHSVITLGLDFMGLMTPDVLNREDGWTPSVCAAYTLSFVPLKRVDSFDGKF